jgi:type I restriction enzyme M protein
MLVEALRDGGVADPAADLVQVLAGLILLRESEARDPQRLAHAGRNSGSVLQDPSNRLNLLRDEWRTIPNLLGTALFQTLEVPEMIARGGRNAARVLEFLGEEVEKHSLGELGGRLALLNVFEATIEFWLHKSRYAGESSTPPALADFILSLAQPQAGERVYDPCFGAGGLLASAAVRMSRSAPDDPARRSQISKDISLFGMELSRKLYPVALARIILSGSSDPDLRVGNSLEERILPDADAKKYDCIVANLPFGIRQPKDLLSKYPIRTASSESLFLQHILLRLRRGGRAVVVVPESFLFRRGPDVELRRRLLEDYSVESVWSLPQGTFAASTSLKTSVLMIRRGEPSKRVIFVSDRLTQPLFDSDARPLQSPVLLRAGTGKTRRLIENHNYDSALRELLLPMADALGAPPATGTLREPSLLLLTTLVVFKKWRSRSGADSSNAWPQFRNAVAHRLDSTKVLWGVAPEETGLAEFVRSVPIEELAARKWELIAKQTGAEELATFLEAIQERLGAIELVKLSEVAEVFSGIGYKGEHIIRIKGEGKESFPLVPELYLHDSPNQAPILVALVRVQDVGPGKHDNAPYPIVRRPLAFLRPDGLSRAREHHRLRKGDILLTRSGSVGNLGIVDDALGGAVPANGIIVMRPNAEYLSLALLRLLQTAPYQTWFRGNASGSVIKHLPTSAVRDLTIPLFNEEQQLRVAEALQAGDNADAVIEAFRDISGESFWTAFLLNDPGVESLLQAGRGQGYSSEWWGALRITIDRCAQLGEQKPTPRESDHFELYMSVWVKHASGLLDAMDFPPGLERYAALQSCDKWALHELWPAKDEEQIAARTQGTRGTASKRFQSLCEVLMDAADTEANRIADSATLSIVLQSTTVLCNRASELSLALANKGMGPLRRVTVAIPELNCRAEVALLRAQESTQVAFSFTPEEVGKRQVHVVWSAEKINGAVVGGSEEVSFEVRPTESAAIIDMFAVNPYVTGAPVDSEETFFGREDVIDRVHRLLRPDGPSTVILLEGNRRVGKTSILKRLQKSDRLDQWVTVYCQFQGVSGEPNAQSLYRLVARQLLYAVGASPVETGPQEIQGIARSCDPLERMMLCRKLAASIGPDRPFERFEELLQESLAAVRPKRILLMLDEFEKIHQGIEKRQMSPLVPENFRYLFHTYPDVSGILSGSIRIKRLRREYWNVLFGIGTPIPVGALGPTAARQLVVRPAEGILSYSDRAVDRVLDLCAYQPFLIQSLASSIFEDCASAKVTSVTAELVNESASSLVLNNEHFYTIFRQQSLTARERFLACLIDSLADAPTRVTFDVIRDQLEVQSIAVESDLRLKEDLEELQEREIIRFVPDTPIGYYRIEVPLFSHWLRAKVDFQAERREAIEE